MTPHRRKALWASVPLALLACLVAWFYLRPRPAPSFRESAFPLDPRLTYQGPFRNIHPDVQYVGDARCVDCHEQIHRTYRKHPMGRSLVPVAQLAEKQDYTAARHNPFEAFGAQLRVDRQGERVFHRQTRLDFDKQPVYDFAHEADFAVGSGSRGHSYFSVRDGFVVQTPISWYSQKQIWDLSPGFAPFSLSGRQVTNGCLFCHANRVDPVPHTRNRYAEPVFRGHAIGCERCHGPGDLHVKSQAKDDIVNPARLDPELREAVCQQCHLEGAARVVRPGRALNDFRPGLPLEEFVSVFVREQAGKKAVNHVEQMYQSVCFQRSSGAKQMGCVSCHDPHEAVSAERRVDHYRDRCLRCHQQRGCSVPEPTRRAKEPADSCIACHMPRFGAVDVVHVAASDHRILRKPAAESAGPGEGPLRPFQHDPANRREAAGRDLGVALYQTTLSGAALGSSDAARAVKLLDAALREYPADVPAWEAKGKILQTLRRPEEAVNAFEELLKRAPGHENALVALGTLYRQVGREDDALECWRRAVERNPWAPNYRRSLVLHLAERNAWDGLRPHGQKWLEQDPASPEARRVWVECLLRSGRKEEARVEFAKLRALRPPNQRELEAWFAEQTR